jgi:mannose-1-phosphate guanylyltransferase
MKNVYFVILAGGSGERLWPLSRHRHPKQLIPFLNNKSLLEQTIERILPLSTNKEQVIVVTNKDHAQAVRQLVGHQIGRIIIEEVERDTGPAILLACHYIMHQDPQALVVVLPSDAYVPNRNAFCTLIQQGINYLFSASDVLTFGLKPTYAATGYGYLQADISQPVAHSKGYKIAQFHEKPDIDHAQEYIMRNDMWWNIGIFAASIKTFVEEFAVHAPSVSAGVARYLQGKCTYQDVQSISIDYAVMEKCSRCVVFPASFEWYDVGNLNIFLTLQAKYSSDALPVISYDGTGNLASTKQKLVVCVGVSDLCIVETDDVILVAQKQTAENVKRVLPQVKLVREISL